MHEQLRDIIQNERSLKAHIENVFGDILPPHKRALHHSKSTDSQLYQHLPHPHAYGAYIELLRQYNC